MNIQSYILGSGRAGQAIAEALAVLGTMEKSFRISPCIWIPRGKLTAELSLRRDQDFRSVLFLANPHGLHAEGILSAQALGFNGVGTEKPFCVDAAQLDGLQSITIPVAVFHGYRQMWGPQLLRQMILNKDFGQLISLEGRYWQASSAERALQQASPAKVWKDDPQLSGQSDALLDVGVHWMDFACYLAGENPQKISGWRSFAGATSAHRDTHVHVQMEFAKDLRAFGSISKIFHGGSNGFEMNVIGTMGSAQWNFLNPDEIVLGRGRDRSVISRKTANLGSLHPAHHGMGWLEGYIEICRELLKDVAGVNGPKPELKYPHLQERLPMMRTLFNSNLFNHN